MIFATAVTARAAERARPEQIFPYKIYSKTLANGLRVLAIPYDSPGTLAYFTVVRAGSRNEVEAGHSGFAHFFEHMMFRGTERFSEDAYNDVLKRMGADSNAFTTDDYTNYYIIGPAKELATMMDIEADRFKNLKYTEDAFKTEALAVLGEYNKGASQPSQPMFEKLYDLAFQKHTYKHTTIGFLDDIKAMPGYYEYSLGFFRRFYRPENAIVVVVGDLKPEQVFALAQKYYGDWQGGFKDVEVPAEPAQGEAKRAHVEWPTPGRPQLLVGYHMPAFSTAGPDSAALDLMNELLFAQSAPLYRELVVEKQWVDGLSGGPSWHRDPNLFLISAQVKTEDLVPKVEQAIAQHMQKLAAQPLDAARLERAKSHLRYAFALGLKSPAAVGFQVGNMLAQSGDAADINRLFDRYVDVTPADIQRVARDTFRPANETVVTLWHGGAGDTGKAEQPGKGGR